MTYPTPAEKLATIPELVREIIEGIETAEFGRAHFKSYGDSALIYEIVYFINDPEYDNYIDIQQQFNHALHRRFAQDGITFAYPTQTVYVQRVSSPSDS